VVRRTAKTERREKKERNEFNAKSIRFTKINTRTDIRNR
jgi:hypothetical protein